MKKLLFISIMFLCFSIQAQTEEKSKVELDSLQSKAFRFEFLECELIKKELNSTEKLLLKEEKTTNAFEKIISIQEKEQMEMLRVIEKERESKQKAQEQNDILKNFIKKKDSKNFWSKLGIGAACLATGFGIGSMVK